MKAEIEKRAEELGVAQEVYKSASILEGLALYGFHDELNKLAQDEKNMKKEEKKEGKENDKGKEEKKNGGKEDEAKGKGGEEKEKEKEGMSKKERFLAMIKEKKEGKENNKKEMKKESSFSGGFKDGFEKTASFGAVAKKVAPYLLGGAALGTAGYAIHRQKKETAATREAIQGLAGGTGRALTGMNMRQKWNDMRDQINEGRLARAVNVNRQAILNLMRGKTSGK